jgi:F-type H+-transporting ATPase subunit gamma
MASLKDLKNRIKSVKSTQKITKAMKMVAAAKLRRAKEHAEAARPYAERMEGMVRALTANVTEGAAMPVLLAGTGSQNVHLLVVATSDRGLCGAFNSSIVRAARRQIADLEARGKTVKIFCVGRKAYEQLALQHKGKIVDRVSALYRTRPDFATADELAKRILMVFEKENCDVCTIVYNHFRSAISQVVTFQQLIPLPLEERGDAAATVQAVYEYEPEEEAILADLLPKNLAVQIFKALLENAASEQGARMTAMDNATRNAGDMISRLTLQYNRSRQAAITKELIEIISGAEAI